MASSVEGRELTEANRVGQLAVAATAQEVSRFLWDDLDVANLDRSAARWMPAQVAAVQRFHGQSNSLADTYLRNYQGAEIGSVIEPQLPAFDAGLTTNALLLAGPARIKAFIGKGWPPDEAKSKALTKFNGIVSRQVLGGGRGAVDLTERGDRKAKGWRRVTDGNPCTFCAMVCARGPVYGSEQRAMEIGGTGLQFHGSCGCTAEIIYGEWTPTEREQAYIDTYEKSAKEAEAEGQSRTQDTVLWRMRRNGDFKDSPKTRNP